MVYVSDDGDVSGTGSGTSDESDDLADNADWSDDPIGPSDDNSTPSNPTDDDDHHHTTTGGGGGGSDDTVSGTDGIPTGDTDPEDPDTLAELLDVTDTGGAPAYENEGPDLDDGYAVTQDGDLIPKDQVPDSANINEQVAEDYVDEGDTMTWDSGMYIDMTSQEVSDATDGAAGDVYDPDQSGESEEEESGGSSGSSSSGGGQSMQEWLSSLDFQLPTGDGDDGGAGGQVDRKVLAAGAVAAVALYAYSGGE